jgi:membrane protein implicated in regulation of membrane protease activity
MNPHLSFISFALDLVVVVFLVIMVLIVRRTRRLAFKTIELQQKTIKVLNDRIAELEGRRP